MGESINTKFRVHAGDIYETPEWVTKALIKREFFEGDILEPCCYSGKISKVLEDNGYTVISSDISRDEIVYGTKGVDVYTLTTAYPNIITNPPYSTITAMVKHFSLLYKKKMALLLKLDFLATEKRLELFVNSPLKVVYIFSSRITMYPFGEPEPTKPGTVEYAWFVWEKGYTGVPVIKWIDDKNTIKNSSKDAENNNQLKLNI